MNMTRDRIQSIGWASLLAVSAVMTGSLMLKVNGVKSQVELSQRRIIALRRENQFLETEYETRANQQQLASINDLDFGYKAPEAGQYMQSERQLAMLGKPRGPDAPAPIELASAEETPAATSQAAGGLGTLVPRLIDRAMAAEVPHGALHGKAAASNLRERLARIDSAPASE